MGPTIEPDPPRKTPERGQAPQRHGTPPLMIAIIIAVLLGGGIWLVFSMDQVSKDEDCRMSGRKNCTVFPEYGR